MNQEQVFTLLRQVLLSLSAGFVTKGYVDNATLQIIISGIVAALTVGWGLYARRSAGLVASAASLPSTVVVKTTDQALADASGAKVVGPHD